MGKFHNTLIHAACKVLVEVEWLATRHLNHKIPIYPLAPLGHTTARQQKIRRGSDTETCSTMNKYKNSF